MKFVVKFATGTLLKYNLVDDPVVPLWKEQISKYTIDDYCKINHYTGYSSKTKVEEKLNRLYELANTINDSVEDKITIVPVTKDNHKQALSIMHVHFPELHLDDNFKYLHETLREYNDTIHWLEGVLHVLYTDIPDSSIFSINLDFNKVEDIPHIELPESSYNLFDPYVNFGGLYLAYTHVGRHAQEIYFAKDLVCPKDQFVPQRRFTASAMMYFTNNFHKTIEAQTTFMDNWKMFYEQRGGVDFWGYDIDDNKLAFGALKIGELEHSFQIDMEIDQFRNTLINDDIVGWEFE